MEHFSQSNYNYISLTKILVFFLFILYVAPCFQWLIIYFLYYENKFPDAYLNKFIKVSHYLFERCCRIQILLQEQYILFKLIKNLQENDPVETLQPWVTIQERIQLS